MPSSDRSGTHPSRRAFVGVCSITITGWAGDRASAQVMPRFAAIRVDTGPLEARGGSGAAGLIARVMPGQLQGVFQDLLAAGDRGLPTLVARIDTLYLTGFAETPAGNALIRAQDTMTGAGLVVAGRGARSETPLRVTLPPSYSGTWYLPDIDARRIDSLSYQFAYWLRREMQL